MMNGNPYQQFQPIPHPGSYYPPPPVVNINDDQRTQAEQYWGTHTVGGPPSVPATSSHPSNNQNTATWGGAVGYPNHQQYYPHAAPYVQQTSAEKPIKNPVDTVLKKFNIWSSKAESTAQNVWHNLKTGSSISETAWGKVNLTAKAMSEGGFEALYKQTFTTLVSHDEKLKKSFACHLSTSTGPVAGTLYLSNLHVAFCSDSPLSFKAPSGQETWSYYKVMVPLGKIGSINPVVMKKENSSDKYIQITTMDGHDFWFMGFVNHDKASHHLIQSISAGFSASGMPIPVPLQQQPF